MYWQTEQYLQNNHYLSFVLTIKKVNKWPLKMFILTDLDQYYKTLIYEKMTNFVVS